MTILAIDDEPVMLVHLETELRKVFSKADIVTFDECDEVLAFLETPQSRSLHYAFMDIKLRGMLGIELAKRIKDQCPQTRILFCTSYSYYALEAYQLHALGYLMKPVDADKLREAVSQIEAQLGTFPENGTETPGKLVVHTFGNFEVLYNGTPLVFEREKAKELLALLIDFIFSLLERAVTSEGLLPPERIQNLSRRVVLRRKVFSAGICAALIAVAMLEYMG